MIALFDKNVCNNLNLTVQKDCNNINLLIKESLLVARDEPILNETVKSFPLELFKLQNFIVR